MIKPLFWTGLAERRAVRGERRSRVWSGDGEPSRPAANGSQGTGMDFSRADAAGVGLFSLSRSFARMENQRAARTQPPLRRLSLNAATARPKQNQNPTTEKNNHENHHLTARASTRRGRSRREATGGAGNEDCIV